MNYEPRTMNDNKIFILLPAYNEGIALNKLIPAIDKTIRNKYSIIVVDDGSSDDISQLCLKYSDKYPIKYLSHKVNKGLGCGLQTGLKYILENSTEKDLLVIMDADNTHNPELINSMLDKITDNDIVIASRYIKDAKQIGVSLLRRCISSSAGKLLKFIFCIDGVKDYTSGYRMYKLKVINDYVNNMKDLPVLESGFSSTAEILLKLSLYDAKSIEIPLILRYDLKESTSKLNILKTIMEYMKLIIKIKVCNIKSRARKV